MARFLKIFLTLLSITAIAIGLYYYFNGSFSSTMMIKLMIKLI